MPPPSGRGAQATPQERWWKLVPEWGPPAGKHRGRHGRRRGANGATGLSAGKARMEPGDLEEGSRSFRAPWAARVEPFEQRSPPGCVRLRLGQLPTARAAVGLIRPSRRETTLATCADKVCRKRAHALWPSIGQGVRPQLPSPSNQGSACGYVYPRRHMPFGGFVLFGAEWISGAGSRSRGQSRSFQHLPKLPEVALQGAAGCHS